MEDSPQNAMALVRDHQACIPLTRVLGQGDIAVLLTPVVASMHLGDSPSFDPFEPLGRALADRHPWIRHVPYTARNGLTSTHVGFIKRAQAVIFVISGPPVAGQSSQIDMAEVARTLGEKRPQIIVACSDVQHLDLSQADFPTILQLPGYSPSDLQAAAAALFGERTVTDSNRADIQEAIQAPMTWSPEVWDANQNDVSVIEDLWKQCLPDQFQLDTFGLRSLLQRDGYAMHFVVRIPQSGKIVGFCATYTTFVDQAGERLIGSLAMIIVNPFYRRRGIGHSLYEHALRQLRRIRGVSRIQLGSTFPRLLYGVPTESASMEWFRRRGWLMDCQSPGEGQVICDLIMRMDDWPSGFSAASSGLTFRQATFDDFDRITDFVVKQSARKDNMGWYDQYTNLARDGRFGDIILGLQQSTIIATALVYTPFDGSPMAQDLPWARTIGSDVGGVTCICITDNNTLMKNSKDTVMIGLLDTCVTLLKEQGMNRVFLDGVRGGHEGFRAIGFEKWAQYRDLWQQV
jgi:ribosomal protein S18 acetylase RimI-like enzyme